MCAVSEYDELPVRHSEDKTNLDLSREVRFAIDIRTVDDPHTKANLLLQVCCLVVWLYVMSAGCAMLCPIYMAVIVLRMHTVADVCGLEVAVKLSMWLRGGLHSAYSTCYASRNDLLS